MASTTNPATAAADEEPATRRPLAVQLRALLDEYEAAALALFSAIEAGTAGDAVTSAANTRSRSAVAQSDQQLGGLFNAAILEHVANARQLDAKLRRTLQEQALPHRVQQHTIDALIAVQRARDDGRKAQIQRLAELKAELDQLVKRGREERREADRAEKEPLSSKQVLDYASYISRITAAPPGYRPPGVGTSSGKDDAREVLPQPTQHLDWPFPSEAQMRRGALAAAAAAGPTAAKATSLATALVSGSAGGEVNQAAHPSASHPQPATHHDAIAPPHAHPHPYGRQEQQQPMDTDDAFDLDLN